MQSIRFAIQANKVLLGTVFITFLASSVLAEEWTRAAQTGGKFSVYSYGQSAYNRPAPFLTLDERRTFSKGSTEFERVRSVGTDSSLPSEVQISGDHNARSCGSCHVRDGRGITHADVFSVTGLSISNAPGLRTTPTFRYVIEPHFATAALEDVKWRLEGRVVLSGGLVVELVSPTAIVNGEEKKIDLRNAPGVYGSGLLEAVPDSELREYAGKQQFAGFGVTGILADATRTAFSNDRSRVGRFGWKGTFATLDNQVRAALANELGVGPPIKMRSEQGGISEYEALVADLTSYLRFLAVPARDPDVINYHRRGAQLFEATGCAMCHKPSWVSSTLGEMEDKLRGQQIYPFTDMLLHDMGAGLRDSNNSSLSSYWRTPALWGIGLQGVVSDKVGFLHDGRARNLLEAILWHAGEADYSMTLFKALSEDDRDHLLGFLSSL